jgi:hypothetical protein
MTDQTTTTEAPAYSVSVPEAGETKFVKFGDAREFADQVAGKGGFTLQVLHLATGAEAYAVNPAALRKRADGTYFQPNTRIENPKFVAPFIAGWVPAYVRSRIQATVLRQIGTSNLLIHDGRTGGTRTANNCKQANEITKAMRHGLEL